MQTVCVYPFSVIFVQLSNLVALTASSRMGWIFKSIFVSSFLAFFSAVSSDAIDFGKGRHFGMEQEASVMLLCHRIGM